MSICLEEIDWEKRVYIAIGSYYNGCKPIIENCKSELFIRDNRVIIKKDNLEISICTNDSKDCIIVLNKEINGLYQHILKTNNIVQSFTTYSRINPMVFTGMISCNLARGLNLVDSFNNVLEKLSIVNGDDLRLNSVIYSEYVCLNKLINSINYLMNSSLKKVFKNTELILGCKTLAETIYYINVNYLDDNIYLSSMKKNSVIEKTEFATFPVDKCFICIEKNVLEGLSESLFENIELNKYKCLVDKELFTIISFLENNYTLL